MQAKLKNEIIKLLNLAYLHGYLNGIECYAYQKDGTYYVGTTGKTMESALKTATKNYNFCGNEGDELIKLLEDF